MTEQELFPKTFFRILSSYFYDIRSFKKNLSDKRITLQEKTILNGWLLLRKNKYRELINTLEALSESPNQFIQDQKHLLLGIAFNNLSLLKEAEGHFQEIEPRYRHSPINFCKYLFLYNYFVLAYNVKNFDKMKEILNSFETMTSDNRRQDLMFRQASLMYALATEQFSEAQTLIALIDKEKDHLSEAMFVGHLFDKLDFYVRTKKIQECSGIIQEMKLARCFKSAEIHSYFSKLTQMLLTGQALYVYEREFPEYKKLYWQLKVLEHLQSKQLEDAEKSWAYLEDNYPEQFGKFPNYLGSPSLFSLALEKLKPEATKVDFRIDDDKSLSMRIRDLLSETHHPINRETLYQLIWGKQVENKEDLMKLQRQIHILRKSFGLKIKFFKGCYSLDAEDSRIA